MKFITAFYALLFTAQAVSADDLLIPSLTLETYERAAIDQGIRGKQSSLTYESAGYSREIAYRLTDSPTLAAAHTHTRSETKINHSDILTDSKRTTLTLNEPLPTGGNVAAVGTYGDANKPGFNASMTQPLYLFVWNPALRSRNQADLIFANAKDTFDSAALAIRSQARSLYYSVMLGEESINVEQRKVDSSKKLLDVTQALVDAGKTAPVETMRVKIRLQSDDRQLQNAVVSREKAVLNAKDFISFRLDEPVHFTTRLQFQPFTLNAERLIEYALVHRPELRVLRRAARLARLDTQATMEATRPGFTLNSTYGYNEILANVTHSWSLGGTASWLFFDSFVTSDRIQKARIAEVIADLNLAQSEQATRVSVQNIYWDIKLAEKQIADFRNQREQAARNVDVLRLRLQNGLNTIVDVFDAENDMRNLDNEYLSLLVQFNQSKDQLAQLIGADPESIR